MTAARLTPFPLRSGTAPLLTDGFTGGPSDGWTETGVGPLGGGDGFDGGNGWGGTDELRLFIQQLGPMDPPVQSTKLSKTYTGLPANTYVRVAVDVAWNYMDFGAAGKPVGMYVNDVLFEPNTTPSGTGLANNGQCVGYGRTSSSGALEIGFGTENITGSCDILIAFDNLRVSRPAAELADIYYDAGVGYIAGNPFSITTGGISFDPGEVLEEYEFPGKRAPVEGCFEFASASPVLRTRFMLTGEYQFEVYRPGGTWSDGELEGMRKYVMAALGAALTTGYLDNFVAIWPRQRGDYIGVLFRKALCRKYGMGSTDKNEGGQDVEILGVIPAGEPLNTVPYELFTLPAEATQVP